MPAAFDRELEDVVKENFQAKRDQRRQFRDHRVGFNPRGGFNNRGGPVGGFRPRFLSREIQPRDDFHYSVGKTRQQPTPRHNPNQILHLQRVTNAVIPSSRNLSNAPLQQEDLSLTRILISNLEFGVTQEDIRELFCEFGRTKRVVINYDKSGRSLGTAEVTYDRRGDAMKAMQHYNGVPLDGKTMSIEIVQGVKESQSSSRTSLPMHSRVGAPNIVPQQHFLQRQYLNPNVDNRPFPSHLAFQRNHNRQFRNQNPFQRPKTNLQNNSSPSKSVETLDKELDQYLVEAAQAKDKS